MATRTVPETAPALGPVTRPGDGTIRSWGRRRWTAAVVGGAVAALAIGIPTDVIPNPVFGRPMAVTWWALPVLVATSVLTGLLVATYVRDGEPPDDVDRPARTGGLAGLLSFFAVGCPVCNKLVVIALGTTGAVDLFAPLQPVLALASLVLLGVALRGRLAGERACPTPI